MRGPIFFPALVAIILGLFGGTTRAQLEVTLTLDKKTFMAHEPVTGMLELINRAGREIVIDGPGPGRGWLDFRVIDGRKHLVSPVPGIPPPKSLILPSGQPFKTRVMVNRAFPMTESGLYRVKVRVYFPPLKRYFESRNLTVYIVDGKITWGPQVVGVPAGYPGAGSYRAYALLTLFQGAQTRSLYFRLTDNDTGQVITTYSLGQYMLVRPLQQVIDSKSRLHVLHMAAPRQYFYTVIGPDGKIVSQAGYRDKGTVRPEIVTNSEGEVAIRGGVSQEELAIPYEEREFRKLSERPPGMPIH